VSKQCDDIMEVVSAYMNSLTAALAESIMIDVMGFDGKVVVK
jgi:hypothetical protein